MLVMGESVTSLMGIPYGVEMQKANWKAMLIQLIVASETRKCSEAVLETAEKVNHCERYVIKLANLASLGLSPPLSPFLCLSFCTRARVCIRSHIHPN